MKEIFACVYLNIITMLKLLFPQDNMRNNCIHDIAVELCSAIEADDEYHVTSLIDDKILVIKLVLCAHCPRNESQVYNYQWTPVHCAARWGRTALLEQLLGYGGIPVDIMVGLDQPSQCSRNIRPVIYLAWPGYPGQFCPRYLIRKPLS